MAALPCAMVKLAVEPNRTWSVPRIVVEAYAQLVQDYPSMHGVWIADHDVVRLLQARYDFAGAGKGNLKVQSVNKYFAEIGPLRLGSNFANYPELNVLGHYQIFRNIKPDEPKTAFYYAGSKKDVNTVPALDRTEPVNAFELDQMVLKSDLCCSGLLKNVERSTTDDVARQLVLLGPYVVKQHAPRPRAITTDDGRRVRQKPGPKPRSKPPPAPKLCRGWSAPKYNPLIRHSLIACLGALPPESEELIPEIFPLIGPKNFYVVYRKRGDPTFCIYCTEHDASDCELDSRSYKHCTACLKASGRIRSFRYHKRKNENQHEIGNSEDVDERTDYRDGYGDHYNDTNASLHYGADMQKL